MLAPYPTAVEGWTNPGLGRQYEAAQAVVGAIRKLRTDYNLTRQRPAVYVSVSSSSSSSGDAGDGSSSSSVGAEFREVVQQLSGDIACLANCSEVVLLQEGEPAPPGCSVAIVNEAVTVHMQLKVSWGRERQDGCSSRQWRASHCQLSDGQGLALTHSLTPPNPVPPLPIHAHPLSTTRASWTPPWS